MNPLVAARSILRQYDVAIANLQVVDQRWNTIVRVDGDDGRTFALRIQPPGHRTPVEIHSDLLSLLRLAGDTALGVWRAFP